MVFDIYLPSRQTPLVLIDDQIVTVNKIKNGKYTYSTNTTNNQIINVKIFSMNELEGRCWFIILYLFFLISFLGIFDKRLDKKNIYLKYEANITINENNNSYIEIIANKLPKKTYSDIIKINCNNVSIDEKHNEYHIDNKLQKRYKILKTFKILTWLAIVVTIIIIFLNT